MKSAIYKRLRREEDGVTLVEFAIVAPVLLLMVMGIFDMAHTQYTSALMNGAMQKAGRDLTLQSAPSSQSAIDSAVEAQIRSVVPSTATITLEKLSHTDFTDIGEAEEFTDSAPLNGICDNNEVFIDANNNGQWDANRGEEGIGGAKDAVLYTVTVSYDRLFPMYEMAGLTDQVQLTASTVLRNQPFADQQDVAIQGNCP
jgi:Flp pilus assembly protein TadG